MERRQPVKKVWVNGTFDILHVGHLKLLELAASLGKVTVGIDSDERVSERKPGRPINDQASRKKMLEALRYVDRVVVFDSDTDLRLKVMQNSPDFFVIGSDYQGKPIIGSEFAKVMVFVDRTIHSSTDIIEKIKNEKSSSNR